MVLSIVTAAITRRRVLRRGLLSIAALLSPVRPARAQADRPTLYVFVQLDTKPAVLERVLQARLSHLTVSVFGRFRDFENAFNGRKPDAVMAIKPLLETMNLKPALVGTRGGRDSEPAMLIAGTEGAANVPGATIGVVDLMGQAQTQALVASLLKRTDIKTKRVAKVEDLLPLLEFSGANAILLPASVASRLLQRTRVALKAQQLPGVSIGNTAVAVLNEAARASVVADVRALDRASNDAVGVEGWVAQ
jgi:hypothetical protein